MLLSSTQKNNRLISSAFFYNLGQYLTYPFGGNEWNSRWLSSFRQGSYSNIDERAKAQTQE